MEWGLPVETALNQGVQIGDLLDMGGIFCADISELRRGRERHVPNKDLGPECRKNKGQESDDLLVVSKSICDKLTELF
jgi:hypothetical protein